MTLVNLNLFKLYCNPILLNMVSQVWPPLSHRLIIPSVCVFGAGLPVPVISWCLHYLLKQSWVMAEPIIMLCVGQKPTQKAHNATISHHFFPYND